MSYKRFAALTALLAGSLCAAGNPAAAADNIGQAVGLTPAANGTVAGVLSVGTPVYRDETIRTGPSGVVELKFLDETNLALGASSSVKLDQFVYAGNGTADKVVVALGRGAFRFATGASPKKAYVIQTPLAAIGVRGTNFTAEITATYERYTIWEGEIILCPTIAPGTAPKGKGDKKEKCSSLSGSGNTLTLVQGGKGVPGGDPVDFPLNCSQGGGELCKPYGGGGGNPDNPGDGRGNGVPPSAPPPSPPSKPRDSGPAGGGNNNTQ